MNRLDNARRTQVVKCLVEGNSIRSTVRLTGVAKNTISKLLLELGAACSQFMDGAMVNLKCERVQCDEIWSFVGAKAKNVTDKHFENGGYAGDIWTWTAIDADTKLIPCWMIGNRDAIAARDFMEDLAGRLASRVQLTSDGHKPYLKAVENAFGNDIDYAMLVKIYGENVEGQKRYSPAVCTGCVTNVVKGNPDPKHISTSYVERANLSMRMGMRRFTRLTNAFSKKIENHAHMVALYTVWYNFVKQHKSLKGISPAMAAGISSTLWEMTDLAEMIEATVAKPGKRGPYKKRAA